MSYWRLLFSISICWVAEVQLPSDALSCSGRSHPDYFFLDGSRGMWALVRDRGDASRRGAWLLVHRGLRVVIVRMIIGAAFEVGAETAVASLVRVIAAFE